MSFIKKSVLLLSLCWLPISNAVEQMQLLDKLDMVEENVTNGQQRIDGKNKILSMLIKCEFDEKCELQMIKELEDISKNNTNLMYKGFLTYLKWEKGDLEYNMTHCSIDAKRLVRKEFASCYADWLNQRIAHPPQDRLAIDKQENEREMCIKKKVEPLAQQGNIFAQAEMVNRGVYLNDQKLMTYWQNQVLSKKGTPEYELFFKCSEIP